jgi:hypothetical protein
VQAGDPVPFIRTHLVSVAVIRSLQMAETARIEFRSPMMFGATKASRNNAPGKTHRIFPGPDPLRRRTDERGTAPKREIKCNSMTK